MLTRVRGHLALGLTIGVSVTLASAGACAAAAFATRAVNLEVFLAVPRCVVMVTALAAMIPIRRVPRTPPRIVLLAE